jgi:hypothetical protein
MIIPLLSKEIEAIIIPADGTPLNFFGGVCQGASTASSVFFFVVVVFLYSG